MSVTTRIEETDLKQLEAIATGERRTNVQMIGSLIDWWNKTHCPECGERSVRSKRCSCKDPEIL